MFFKYSQTNPKIILGLIILISLSLVACGSQQPSHSITGIEWPWNEMVEFEPASQSLVPDPQNYIVLFSNDASVSITADCNKVGGSYTLNGSSLSIALGPSTLAFCREK